MDATALIAGYAAVVASGSAIVQYLTWRGNKTTLTVTMNPGEAVMFGDTPGEAIFVNIVNPNAYPVKLTGLQFEDASGQSYAVTHPFPTGESLPYTVPERDQITIWANRNGFKDVEGLLDVVRARVWTAADEKFESPKQPLDELPRLGVATIEHV